MLKLNLPAIFAEPTLLTATHERRSRSFDEAGSEW